MNVLYLDGFANFVSCENGKLIVVNKIEQTRKEYQMQNIPFDHLVVASHTGSISWSGLRYLVKHNVTISTLHWSGSLLSVTLPVGPSAAKLRLCQYKAYLDQDKRYYIAHAIVKEKIKQSLNLLRELSKYYAGIDIKKVEHAFDKENKFYTSKNDVDALITHEGRVADIYFNSLINGVFSKLDFDFRRRNNNLNSHIRNAADPVNALFNYGYAMLESEIRKDINTIGMDPSLSLLHSISDNRSDSLVYDLMELARSWAVDLSVIKLLEEKKLKRSDFIVTENFNIRLREKAATLLISKIKETMNSRVPYKNANFTYQNILFNNVRILANYISGKQDKLEFNIPLIQIKRNDELQLRDKVLNLTTEDRKRLGINKSTLWYQKKHIREGKKIKIYNKVMNKL
jgi:CRISP-associated protein Cas1